MIISAIRYTFADPDDHYNDILKPVIVSLLTAMLNDADLENRRLGLTALNSAIHNKPTLIIPHLDELVPLVMKESQVKPELIREVQMGPFKHKVDDGLEVRKVYFSLRSTMSAQCTDLFNRVPTKLCTP
jgi:cullin-associated NEDD8-dissociated protein 1